MKGRTWVFLCHSLIAVLVCATGCSNRSPHVHYVMPTDFRGAVVIYTKSAGGRSFLVHNNCYICTVPESGILRYEDEGPIYVWHTTSASFCNGDAILVADGGIPIPMNVVAFWHGGSRPGGMSYFFIGTLTEKIAFDKQSATGDVTPGSVVRK